MRHVLPEVFAGAVMSRLVLLANHLLASEPVAAERLRRHAGRRVQVQMNGWPGLLPAPPSGHFAITPAGLLEWVDGRLLDAVQPDDAGAWANGADLRIVVDARNPARLFAAGLLGQRPALTVSGDAGLAADVNWIVDNVRWDVSDDLSRWVGERPAQRLASTASTLASGLRGAVQGLARRVAGGRRDAPASGAATGAGADAFSGRDASPAQPPVR